jgi:hypothetical protein
VSQRAVSRLTVCLCMMRMGVWPGQYITQYIVIDITVLGSCSADSALVPKSKHDASRVHAARQMNAKYASAICDKMRVMRMRAGV